MALAATKLAVLILCIVAINMMMLGPTGTGANQYVSVYNQTTASIISLQNASTSTGNQGIITQIGTALFVIIPDIITVFKQMFVLLPTTTMHILELAVPITITVPGGIQTNIGDVLGYLVFFLMAISALSWLYGRFQNP